MGADLTVGRQGGFLNRYDEVPRFEVESCTSTQTLCHLVHMAFFYLNRQTVVGDGSDRVLDS